MGIFISLILLFVYQHTTAQAFDNIISFTTQNGLSNNSITCLEKDEDGFLWIGTHEGLNQYDGTEFVNVLSNAKNNLPSNIINKICYINKTTLAISTQGGLCFLNTKTLEGQKAGPPDSKTPGQSTYLAWDILYDKKKKELWVGTADGLYVLSDEGKLKRKIEADKTDPARGVFALYLFKDKFDNIFFFSQKRYGFFYADFDKKELLPLESKLPDFPLNELTGNKYNLRGASFIDNKIICCFSNTDVANKKSILAFYDNVKGRGVTDSFSTKFTNALFLFNSFPLSDSVLLVNSYFGEPYLYNLNTLQIKSAASHPLWFTSWPDGIYAKLLADEKNIWVATSKGLLQIPQYQDIF